MPNVIASCVAWPALLVAIASLACGSNDPAGESGPTSGITGELTTATTESGASSEATSEGESTESSDTGGEKLDVMNSDMPGFVPIPVRELPGLESITFYERTGGTEPEAFTFLVDGAELTNYVPGALSPTTADILGTPMEYYDVYYSDIDGVFDIDGSYLTISGEFANALPSGGGLNLAEISLNYAGVDPEFGNYVASFAALGDNAAPDSVDNAIDADLQTHTTMGNTSGQSERLRVTLGFESSSGPVG